MMQRTLSEFLCRLEALGERCVRFRWGVVTADSRFPDVHDANHALVLGENTPKSEEVLEALRDVHAHLRTAFEQVEVVDVQTHASLCDALQRHFGEPRGFALMLADAESRVQPSAEVVELPPPDEPAWLALRRAAHEETVSGRAHTALIPDDVLRQLARRTLVVFFPAGRRLFAVTQAGRSVSAATMQCIADVGLIDDVVTTPECRRRGYATAVVSAALNTALGAGARHVILFTDERGAARQMYERIGFTEIARSAQFHKTSARGDPDRI